MMKPILLPILAATAAATDLLLPLYQYPANNGGAWSPIEQAMTANPSLTFKVIINPNNGPGGPGQGIDDPQYAAGTKALASHPNAQLIGYVHTSTDWGATRCNVPWPSITADIKRWATWPARGVAIKGIFIDEAPVNTANDCVAYMRNLTTFLRTDPDVVRAFGTNKPIIVFNPGGVGALQPYYDLQPDLIVALETCFVVPARAGGGGTYDDQCSPAGGYERYDHDGVGSSLDNVVFPSVGRANAARTAVLVHGFHDFNGPAANMSATVGVLGQLIRGVVQRKIGATFFNTAGYHTFTDGPASIGAAASALRAANGA
ncbi:hypothetical protein N657DRAFT_650465 [Parathielavia appendiculata]|uniref:Spherulation-specific family 4 n=1 Tax=Parathielavia appendiculata TaxID=2587402 RepID=A0AAN6TR55_9PEZI|nr:hypothetical protein N657DRAFT_650465 [Parathielavia appendiculata]